jgi:hypothetical protein
MSIKPNCSFQARYDARGGLWKGECACGKIFYPYSTEPTDSDEALKYMEQQWRSHHDERYPKEES